MTDDTKRRGDDAAFWRAQGMKPRGTIDRPEPGFWAIRLTRGGVEVGARIWWHQTRFEPGVHSNLMERSPILSAEIDGKPVTPYDVRIQRGREISEEVYLYLVADRAWARKHRPEDPAANPRKPVDLRAQPPVMPPRRRVQP